MVAASASLAAAAQQWQSRRQLFINYLTTIITVVSTDPSCTKLIYGTLAIKHQDSFKSNNRETEWLIMRGEGMDNYANNQLFILITN